MNLEDLKNRTILMLGKSRAFSVDEFASQLKYHKITAVKELVDGVGVIVEGRMMTPYEQNESDELYEQKKYKFVKIDDLEKALAKDMDNDTLLMSLKLSHDKERLKSFLQNAMLNDELFFKLLKMYKWQGEDFFENDDNRDVSAAFISRFYENIERNHNVQYATTGFIHLVAQTKDANLLKEISKLEPLSYHPKIKSAIAISLYCDESMQKSFFNEAKQSTLEALSFNKNLSRELVKEFLKEDDLVKNIAKSVNLDDELFWLLEQEPVSLSQNESLSLGMQEELLALNKNEITLRLAQNNGIDEKIISKLLLDKNEEIKMALYQNGSTPVAILQEAYADESSHEALSKNENTPIDILYQLQLDSRYERFVKTNAGYGKHIQTENIGWLV